VLVRLTQQARGSMADFLTGEGHIDIKKAQRAKRLHLLKSYTEPGEKSGGRIDLYDAQAALVTLGKHLGLFREWVEITGKNGGPVEHVVDLSGLSNEELDQLAGIAARLGGDPGGESAA